MATHALLPPADVRPVLGAEAAGNAVRVECEIGYWGRRGWDGELLDEVGATGRALGASGLALAGLLGGGEVLMVVP